ncbi:MAG: hypothetical protein KF708_06240 [Pirellulales bacterium]|nr:hypothetical protein [Pirellulales bacterium]
MSEHDPHDESLNELAARLAHLVPDAGGLQRDRILFEAGRRAGRRQARQWNLAALLSACAMAAVAAWTLTNTSREAPSLELSTVPAEQVRANLAEVDPPTNREPLSADARPARSGASYLVQRTRMTAAGLPEPEQQSIPSRPVETNAPPPTPTRRALEKALLEELWTPT